MLARLRGARVVLRTRRAPATPCVDLLSLRSKVERRQLGWRLSFDRVFSPTIGKGIYIMTTQQCSTFRRSTPAATLAPSSDLDPVAPMRRFGLAAA